MIYNQLILLSGQASIQIVPGKTDDLKINNWEADQLLVHAKRSSKSRAAERLVYYWKNKIDVPS